MEKDFDAEFEKDCLDIEEPISTQNPNFQTNDNNPDGFQPVSLNDPAVLKLEHLYNARYTTIAGYAKFVRIYAFIDSALCLLFFISEYYYLVVLIAVPIVGYLSGYHLNRSLLSIYILYEIVITFFRLIITSYTMSLLFQVLTTMIVIFTFFVMLFLIRYWRFLGRINKNEKDEIYLLMHGNVKVRREIMQQQDKLTKFSQS